MYVETILWVVVLIIMIKLKHLFLYIIHGPVLVVQTWIMLQIIQSKRRATDLSPGIMDCLPRLCVEERLAAFDFRFFKFHVSSKVRPDEVIASIDIEFVQKEASCPIGILIKF